MTPETVLTVGRQVLEVTILLTMVLLVPGLIVGLLVAVFQAATQINEMTLSFIPKLLVTFLVIVLAGPWLINVMVTFTQRLFEGIPGMIG